MVATIPIASAIIDIIYFPNPLSLIFNSDVVTTVPAAPGIAAGPTGAVAISATAIAA
jgi:hypothetical protein